jgi:hypothetical protein
VKNVTTPPPRTVMPPKARQNQLIVLAVILVLFVVLVRACAGHENKYEHIARELTEAAQKNDYTAVTKLENSETVAETTRARLGNAADKLAPLGAVKRVKDTTPEGDPARVHEFEVTFDKGTVHEKIQFDPDDKVFHFGFDAPKLNS